MIPWTNWHKVALTCCILNGSVPLFGQSIEHYIDLACRGEVDEVTAALPVLKKQYPNSGSILYLTGLVTLDGDEAVEQYNRLVQLYPSNAYADDALLKIGEFLYSRGLYLQAAAQLRRIPLHYPRSELVYPSIRLLLNALLVSGNRDTARFYSQVFAKKYPEITFNLDEGRVVVAPDSRDADMAEAQRLAGEATGRRQAASTQTGTYRLQIGAFGVPENAARQRDLLESLRYEVVVKPSHSGQRKLYIVYVQGFSTRQEAESTGVMLKKEYGLNYIIQSVD